MQQDARRFISQRTGDLYIAKVEASDVGNYTCAVRNMMTNATVFSSPTPVVVRRDGKRTSPVRLRRSWLRRAAVRVTGQGDELPVLSVTLVLLRINSEASPNASQRCT